MEEGGAFHFSGAEQEQREHFRSIVLFGRNVASYKFALAKSLLELSTRAAERVSLHDLADPYSRYVCEHIADVDRQGTMASSKFLDACRFYNAGNITADELHDATVIFGFNNVIDAFHVVGPGEVPTRFFVDERKATGGIVLTDATFELSATNQAGDLVDETEARWRLVEDAWTARASGEQTIVLYDAPRDVLVPALTRQRRPIAHVRPALNGYQKGFCFYCFRPITVASTANASDVDHFLPHSLMARGFPHELDSPWNLVLACQACNRGPAGKFAALPDTRYVARLFRRNEFLIGSHHPLRETLILATGATPVARRAFLASAMDVASPLANGGRGWRPTEERRARF